MQNFVNSRPANEDAGPTGSPSSPLNSQHGPQRRKRVACKECRQAKLRCDASSNPSGSCSHCRRLNRVCQVDVSYKRVSRRLRVEELAEQVQHLRSVVASTQATSVSQGNQDAESCPAVMLQDQQDNGNSQTLQSHASPSTFGSSSAILTPESRQSLLEHSMVSPPMSESQYLHAPTSCDRRIDHLTINQAEINELFQIFFERNHPYLAILDPSLSPDEYYAKSPLLFWAIISVACRRYEPEPTLVSTLAPSYMRLLWSEISSFPHKPYLIQAILLTCTWPFPTSSMWIDPSFMLVSIAKAAAIQLGLHRPEIAQDFARQKIRPTIKDVQESSKTWAGCYIVAQSIAVSIGQQPLIIFDWAIDRATEVGSMYTLPNDLRHSVIIQQFSCRISHLMSDNRQSATGLPAEGEIGGLLVMLESELTVLERSLRKEISDVHEIMLSYAALQLRTFHFFEPGSSESRRPGLLRAFRTAVSLITVLNQAKSNHDAICYAPSHFGRIIVVAGVVLLKVLHSSYSKYVEFEAGKRAFNSAISLLRSSSLENNDLHGRSSKILSQLWSFHSNHSPKNDNDPKLTLKSRSSASVLHDALWLWRERFGKEAAGYVTLSESTSQDRINLQKSPVIPDLAVGLNESRPREDMQLFGSEFDFDSMNSIWDSNLPLLMPIDFDGNLIDISI